MDWNHKKVSRGAVEGVTIHGIAVKPGDRVRLWPKKSADIMDMALRGKAAIVESIERDFDNHIHFAVVIEDDPGRDFGMQRQPGHRFFFSPQEIEPLSSEERQEAMPKILVAGIGNIFLGDDGFGVEVVKRLAQRSLPQDATVVDFGIRSYDLAYALMEGWKLVILVDAVSRGGAPGTLYTLEPELPDAGLIASEHDAHTMNTVSVLQLVSSLGGRPGPMLLVGCEPATLDPDRDGNMRLSPVVEQAANEAVGIVEELINRARRDTTAA